MKAAHQSPDGAWAYLLQVAMAFPAWFGSGAAKGPLVGVEAAAVEDTDVVALLVVAPLLSLVLTQYALPAQKLVRQSADTAGFQARN